MPSWAFFLRCFLNTRNLRPTASREDFYEDEELGQARKEFSRAVSSYLAHLAQVNSEQLRNIVQVHSQMEDIGRRFDECNSSHYFSRDLRADLAEK